MPMGGYIDGTLHVFSWEGDELAVSRAHRKRVASLSIESKALLSGGWDRRV